MPRASTPLRALTLLVAVLQLLLPGVVSLADARAEAEGVSRRAAAHIETPGGERCPAIHADDCGLCQFLSAPRFDVRRQAALPLVECLTIGAPSGDAVFSGALRRGAPRPRAPPAT